MSGRHFSCRRRFVPDRSRLLHSAGLPGRLRRAGAPSKQWNDREIEMSSPIRRFARIGAATLAIGLATGVTFLAFAHEALQPAPDICATPAGDVGGEAPFLAENNVAMKKMMNDMAVTPTGDVDADFVAMM